MPKTAIKLTDVTDDHYLDDTGIVFERQGNKYNFSDFRCVPCNNAADFLVPYTQKASAVSGAGSSIKFSLVFPKSFENIPIVVCSITGWDKGGCKYELGETCVYITDVSKTSVTGYICSNSIGYNSTNTGTATVSCLAVDSKTSTIQSMAHSIKLSDDKLISGDGIWVHNAGTHTELVLSDLQEFKLQAASSSIQTTKALNAKNKNEGGNPWGVSGFAAEGTGTDSWGGITPVVSNKWSIPFDSPFVPQVSTIVYTGTNVRMIDINLIQITDQTFSNRNYSNRNYGVATFHSWNSAGAAGQEYIPIKNVGANFIACGY